MLKTNLCFMPICLLVWVQTVRRLEEEEDINQIKDFFSYEHFYVIYCKFWELDKDHDLYIDKADLSRHNDHGKLVRNNLLQKAYNPSFSSDAAIAFELYLC